MGKPEIYNVHSLITNPNPDKPLLEDSTNPLTVHPNKEDSRKNSMTEKNSQVLSEILDSKLLKNLLEISSELSETFDVRIAKDRETGRAKGFALVDFDTSDAVTKAIAKAGENLDGRDIRVDLSTPRVGGGDRGGRGGDRGGRGGFGGGRGGGRGGFGGNPMDKAKKSGGIIAGGANTKVTFDDSD